MLSSELVIVGYPPITFTVQIQASQLESVRVTTARPFNVQSNQNNQVKFVHFHVLNNNQQCSTLSKAVNLVIFEKK